MNLKKLVLKIVRFFDDIMTAEDIDSSDILLDKKTKNKKKTKIL